MKRRAFMAGLGAAVALPLAARAQQPAQMRRIGVLMPVSADNLEIQADLAAFVQGLQRLGWIDGSNMQIDIRWSGGDPVKLRQDAAALMALNPDVVVAGVGPTVQALQQAKSQRSHRHGSIG